MFYWIVMNVVESLMQLFFNPYHPVGKFVPNATFLGETVLNIPFPGCGSVQVFQDRRNRIEQIYINKNMIMVW